MARKPLNALFGRVLLPLLLAAALVPRPVRTPFVNDPISEKVSESAAVDTEDGKERLNKTSEGNTSHDHAEHIESITAEEVTNEFIVRFNEYRFAGEHKRALEHELGTNGWRWIERNNPASFLPTDFGLLEIEIGYIDSICQQLKDLNFIKDISPQMRFTRAPLAEKKNANDMDMDTHQLRVTQAPVQGDSDNVWKPRGRPLTWMSIEEDDEFNWKLLIGNTSFANKRSLLLQRSQITSMFGAEKLWAKGFSGAKVKMAVFDTGVRADHPHFRNIKERTNWTNEDTLNDNLGHGTFVAGVISSQDPQCLGFAPDAEIYAFRVFTDAQVSYTSWFLDAFNYAIAKKINILNLSIGGPDYLDRPFVEKVWEMTANNIIMISAIGNDGPLYGTLNNPADQNDVIGVGGIDYNNHIASFSSRGMSTWELPHGYGRMKPDIVAYGREVIGSKINSGCKSLSGTSVASPVVAGAVCLLASTVPEEIRWNVLNPASMKQALMEGAIKLDGPNMYEQGAGRLNLLNSFEILANYIPRASIMPEVLDLTNCPYAWPFCRQPLYADAMPTMFNATILNGMGVVGYIQSGPFWIGHGQESSLLDIRFTYPDVIWPWTGYLGLYMQIKPEGRYFLGTIQGNVTFTVISPPPKGETKWRSCQCTLPIKVAVIPTPARGKRILWDQFHSIRYPPGYIPRDSLDVRNDILDWHGDHLHTNFHGLFDMLSDAGYYLETLGSPLTCFDAKQYGTLLMVDLEDEFYREEIDKLKIDVEIEGLGLIVFADWYNVETMVKMKFFDDNTRSWWTPATGGSNIPALNDLLAPFGIAFGDTILNGAYSIGGERAHYASGTDIRKFPMGGYLHRFLFHDNSGSNVLLSTSRSSVRSQVESPILGVVKADKGRIAAYGDSNCLDSSHMITNCYWLLRKLLDFTSYDIHDPVIFSQNNLLLSPFGEPETSLPTRRSDLNFSTYSLVLTNKLQCGNDSPFYFHESGNQLHDSLPQRQPRGTGNSSSSLMNETTQVESTITLEEDGGTKYVRPEVLLVNNSISGEASKETGNREKDIDKGRSFHRFDGRFMELGLPFVWSNKNELDWTVLALVHWLIPLICVTGFILILNLWRARQKRRRRTRKGPTRLLLF